MSLDRVLGQCRTLVFVAPFIWRKPGSLQVILFAVIIALAGFAQRVDATPTGLVGWWAADGDTTDRTGNNPPGTLEGNATFGPGVIGQAFALHGAPDWVNLGTNTGNFASNNFTVDLWVKFNTLNGEQNIVAKYVETFGPGRSGWSMERINDRIFFGFDGLQQLNAQSIAPSTWYNLAVTRSGTTFTLYLNGVPIDVESLSGFLSAPTAPLKIGHRGSPADTPGSLDTRGFFLDGFVDEVMFFDRGLGADEILSLAETPEPATFLLFGTTAAGLGLARWRRRRRRKE
jgi:trimeric autotransporter adhesin